MFECIIIFAILCTSCVPGVLEVCGVFNDRSEQPDSHFIPSSATGSGGVVYIIFYHLLWAQGRWLFLFQISRKWIAMVISPPPQQPKRHPAANTSPYMSSKR